jgi:RNAse (barnase) inhibitor barstar
MNSRNFDLDFSRPLHGGVYFVQRDELDRLAIEAKQHELHASRIELAGCRDKADLLQRFARALRFPADFGDNWDALADCLRDLAWLPGWGHLLLLDRADELQRAAPDAFAVLLGILDDAATFAQESERPFFAFLTQPDDAAGSVPH